MDIRQNRDHSSLSQLAVPLVIQLTVCPPIPLFYGIILTFNHKLSIVRLTPLYKVGIWPGALSQG